MSGNLHIITVQALEDNQLRAGGEIVRVEDELHLDFAVPVFGSELNLRGNRLSAYGEDFAGRLVHERTTDGVLGAGDELV